MSSINTSAQAFAVEIREMARRRITNLPPKHLSRILADAESYEVVTKNDDYKYGYHIFVTYPNGRQISLLKDCSFHAAEVAHAHGFPVEVHGWSYGAYSNLWEVAELRPSGQWVTDGSLTDDEVVEFCLTTASRPRAVLVRRVGA